MTAGIAEAKLPGASAGDRVAMADVPVAARATLSPGGGAGDLLACVQLI